MTYKEALEEQKHMVEFREKHYTNISKQTKPSENEENSTFQFSET